MSNPFNGSKRGKRGGSPDRASRKSAYEYATSKAFIEENRKPSQSMTAIVSELGKHFENSEVGETEADYLIPRRSLTAKLHLRYRRQQVTEAVEVKSKQAALGTGKPYEKVRVAVPSGQDQFGNTVFKPQVFTVHPRIEVTDQQVTSMSDKTLLIRGKAVRPIEDEHISRQGSNTKVIRRDQWHNLLSGNAVSETIHKAKKGTE